MTKIVGAGLSKTGTTSLHRALELLGLKSLHYDDRRLNDVIAGTESAPDFRRYDDVDAVLDIPSAYFFEELLQAYPQSRCILTIRDEDGWWKSIEKHFNHKSPVASYDQHPFKWNLRHCVYGSATAREFLYRKRYRQHNAYVQQMVPADRLLVMNIPAGDGWEQLCPFLGRPIPDVPFPHQNRQVELDERYWQAAISELAAALPATARFILVDQNSLDTSGLAQPRPLPFLEREGAYGGPPADDDTALAEFERLRQSGASHIVFAWPAFWWLEYYRKLREHLDTNFPRVYHNDRFVIFDLRRSNAC